MFVCIINCSCDLYCRYEMRCITRVEYRAKRNIFKCKYCLWICPLMIIIWSMLNSSPSRYNIWDTAIRVFLFPFYVALFLASHSFNITTDLFSVYWHTHAADSISVGILRPFDFNEERHMKPIQLGMVVIQRWNDLSVQSRSDICI